MNRKSGSGSGPFLMEMLVVVGFFIICASICVMVFVRSDNISKDARDINQAVLRAQSLAEELKAGQEPRWSDMLPDRTPALMTLVEEANQADSSQADWYRELVENDSYEGMRILYWNSSWEITEPDPTAPYLGVICRGKVDGMQRTDILILRYGSGGFGRKVLYRLQTETYEAL